MDVRVGYMPQVLNTVDGTAGLAGMLHRIEAAGLDHVGVGDHVSFHVGFGFDGLVNATALCVLHPTLPVHTAVYLLALRHPVLVARQLSTLSLLAPGRLTLGVGIGGEDRREVVNAGVDPATRGRRMDEVLSLLRPLMAGESVSHRGEFFTLDEAMVLPAPDPAPPLVVGGRSDAAIDRAGRLGDGWLGLWVQIERWREAMQRYDTAAGAAGRVDRDPHHELLLWCGLGATREEARERVAAPMQGLYQIPFDRFEKYCPYGRPEDVAEFLVPFVGESCGTIHLIAMAGDEEDAIGAAGEVRRLLVAG